VRPQAGAANAISAKAQSEVAFCSASALVRGTREICIDGATRNRGHRGHGHARRRRRGKQYVVVHAGGGVFANGKRGDGIWMFSLDGTIESIKPETAPTALAAARAEATAAAPLPAAAGPVDLDNGARLYREACLPCHGPTGEGGGAGSGAGRYVPD
jgi:hypothetical protein